MLSAELNQGKHYVEENGRHWFICEREIYQLSQFFHSHLDNLTVQFPVSSSSLGSEFLESGVTNVKRRRNLFSFLA